MKDEEFIPDVEKFRRSIAESEGVELKELNLLLDENYNKLQEHLIMGYKKLYKIRELYFGGTEKQPLEASPTCTKVDMIITIFNDMHNFINTTEEFLDLL